MTICPMPFQGPNHFKKNNQGLKNELAISFQETDYSNILPMKSSDYVLLFPFRVPLQSTLNINKHIIFHNNLDSSLSIINNSPSAIAYHEILFNMRYVPRSLPEFRSFSLFSLVKFQLPSSFGSLRRQRL